MAPASPFRATVITETPQAVVLKLTGEIRLDSRDAEMEFNRIAARRSPLTVVDMSEFSFISSLGMGLLVALKSGISRQGRKLRIAAIQPMVLTALQRTRLDAAFDFFPTVEAALEG